MAFMGTINIFCQAHARVLHSSQLWINNMMNKSLLFFYSLCFQLLHATVCLKEHVTLLLCGKHGCALCRSMLLQNRYVYSLLQEKLDLFNL